MTPDWQGRFWKGVFSESDGTPSSSRVLSAIIVAFALGWVTAIVIEHLLRHYEPALPDLAGLAAFVAALYGVNKITAIWKGPGQ